MDHSTTDEKKTAPSLGQGAVKIKPNSHVDSQNYLTAAIVGDIEDEGNNLAYTKRLTTLQACFCLLGAELVPSTSGGFTLRAGGCLQHLDDINAAEKLLIGVASK